MPGESLSFPIFAEDHASKNFREVGDAALGAAGKIDIAAASLKLWDDTSVKSKKATDTLIASRLAVAKADNTLAKAEGFVTAEAEKASRLLSGEGLGGGSLGKLLSGAHGLSGGLSGIVAGVVPAAAAVAAALGPILIGTTQIVGALAAAGAGVAAFGILAIPQFKGISNALGQIKTDTLAYDRATTAASKSLALKHIRDDWAALSPAQRGAVHGIQSLQAEFGKLSAKLAPITFKVFNEGLKIADKLLPDLLPFARAAGTAIDGLLKSLNKFVTPIQQSVKPAGDLGSKLASISAIPPPTGFQKFLTTLQGLSGPAITALGKGMGQIAIAVGKLIVVSASPDSIKTLTRVLGFLAAVIDVVSWAINRASGNMQKWVDIAHQTASKFDEFRHDTAVIFDGVRRDIAHAWDLIWHDTIGQVQRGVHDVNVWFDKLPGLILGSLRGLGHSLYAFGHAALNELWSGFKSVGGSILSWAKNFILSIPHAFMNLLHMSPPHPGSVFFDLGASFMHHLEAGMKSRAQGIGFGAITGALGGGTGPAGVIAIARQLAASYGWLGQWSAINAVAMRESGWSTTARNPSSGAYGIAQFINGPSEYYQYGGNPFNAGGQIIAFYNYIKQRYGSPAAAWAHELSFGWYDRGGWLPPGLSLALNQTGAPERVGGGNTYNITVHVPPTANKAEVGRATVEAIKEFEKRSGTGWRR